MPTRTYPDERRLYRLDVSLLDVRPRVWRRLLVPAEMTLSRLHRVLQVVMGWEGYHLHRFHVDGRDYGGVVGSGERTTRLSDLGLRAGDAFYYEYDFGDGWEHEVHVEGVLDADPKKAYPVCTGGARACPPEDSGGPWGYMELLHVLRRRRHPRYRELREWVGPDFDPARFRRGPINQALKEIARAG